MWFELLTGFKEESPKQVRDNIRIENGKIISLVNSKEFVFGNLEIPTLEELRENSYKLNNYRESIQVSEVVANVRDLHRQTENAHALFQVASQFNLLEMINPNVTPEHGVGRYEFDNTQGPICAIACGAGTIYRNYFVELNGQTGQTANNQIDCMELIGKELDNEKLKLWEMKNGYAMFTQSGLQLVNKKLSQFNDTEREKLKGKLKTGIQWNTEVTISESKHKVTQIYCSALPISYNNIDSAYWEEFARIILEALYESTLYTGMLNMERNGSNLVYLTLVGGGVFGNNKEWILDSIRKAIDKFRNVPLDIKIVSYKESKPAVKELISRYS